MSEIDPLNPSKSSSSTKYLKFSSLEIASYIVENAKKIFSGAAGSMVAISLINNSEARDAVLIISFLFASLMNSIFEYLHEIYMTNYREGNTGYLTDILGIFLRISGGIVDTILSTIIGSLLVNANTVSRIEMFVSIFAGIAIFTEFLSEYTPVHPSILRANRLRRVLYGKQRKDLKRVSPIF